MQISAKGILSAKNLRERTANSIVSSLPCKNNPTKFLANTITATESIELKNKPHFIDTRNVFSSILLSRSPKKMPEINIAVLPTPNVKEHKS